jgi:hypothetical protein
MQTRLMCKLIKLQPQSIDLHPMARLRDGKSYHLSPPTPWLDATGFGRSRTMRPGVGGAGGVLRASDGCEGELVGVPHLPRRRCCAGAAMVVGLGGCAGACCWLRGGAPGCVGPILVETLRKQGGACYCHGWERAIVLVLIRAKAFADDVGCDGGGALWASFFPAGV